MFTISKLAQTLGVCPDTVVRWEREGLIPKARRSPGGWRVYTEEDLEQIQTAALCRDNGQENEEAVCSGSKTD